MKLDSLVTSLLAKSGELYKYPEGTMALINNLSQIDIPDDIASATLNNIMTLDEGRKSPELFGYFTQLLEKNFNDELDQSISVYKFDQATIDQIKSAPSIGKKAALLASKAHQSETGKYNGVQLQKKIEELLDQNRDKSRDQFDDTLNRKIEEAKRFSSPDDVQDNRREIESARNEMLQNWKGQ